MLWDIPNMNRWRTRSLFFISFLTLCVLAGVLLFFARDSSALTITVDDDGEADYTDIRDAMDNAANGDTIRIWGGNYNCDNPLVCGKALNLIGNGSKQTILSSYLTITKSNTIVEGLSFHGEYYGMLVEKDTHGVLIRNCSMESSSSYGIYCYSPTKDLSVSGCTIRNCSFDGVRLQNAVRCQVRDSVLENCYYGVTLSGERNIIENCTSTDNSRGVCVLRGDGNSIINCSFERNDIGILDWGEGTILENNNFRDNGEDIAEKEGGPLSFVMNIIKLAAVLVVLLIVLRISISFVKARRKRARESAKNAGTPCFTAKDGWKKLPPGSNPPETSRK